MNFTSLDDMYKLTVEDFTMNGGKALLEEVSDRRFDVFDRSIDVHVSQLRRKLGDDAKQPRFIRTIRGVGYKLEDTTP